MTIYRIGTTTITISFPFSQVNGETGYPVYSSENIIIPTKKLTSILTDIIIVKIDNNVYVTIYSPKELLLRGLIGIMFPIYASNKNTPLNVMIKNDTNSSITIKKV